MGSRDLSAEFNYRTSRSSGPGGQHVNKVASKVELLFDVEGSATLSDNEKAALKKRFPKRITADGVLHLVCQKSRSQHKNKQKAVKRFYKMLEKAFQPEKKRIPTKPTKGMIEKRLKEKRLKSEKKQMRRKPSS